MRARRYALVAGGGTGGHLLPALAVARALAGAAGPQSVELVGSRRGLDAELLEGMGVPATLLPGRGLARRRDLRALAANAGAAAEIVAAVVMAMAVVARRRPSVVVAMGGYACVPTALAAALLRVPVVLVNVDAVPGAANRLVGRFAHAAAVAFEGTPLPRAIVTGAPVRDEIVRAAAPDDAARRRARRTLGVPEDRLVVAAVGGSLGARRVNEAIVALAARWAARADVAVYHVVGRRDAAWAADAARRQGILRDASAPRPQGPALVYVQVPYEDRMALFYQCADVVVGRSGASTVAELTVVGVPSLLVPLPGAPDDHQRANARVLEVAGAAVVVPDEACDGGRVASEIDALCAEPGRLAAMAAAAGALGRPDAAEAVASVARAHARTQSAAAQATRVA